MRIVVDRATAREREPREAEIYLDADGDLNIVVAAVNLEGVRDEDLVVCCIKDDAAWIRGLAPRLGVDKMTRLLPGDSVTLVIE
jgi:hypothetical protein